MLSKTSFDGGVARVVQNCNEDDVSWLSVEDESNIAHCDNCGSEFELDDHQ
jgi:transcription elongation factor Elf1